MNPNPYKSVPIDSSVKPSQPDVNETFPIPIILLWIFGSFTLILALINSYQEQVPGILAWLTVSIGAVVPQILGLVFAELHRRKRSKYTFTFLVPAFLVSLLSMFGYLLLVMAGQLQTVDNAAQMHVIFVPILLIGFAAIAYLLASVVAIFL